MQNTTMSHKIHNFEKFLFTPFKHHNGWGRKLNFVSIGGIIDLFKASGFPEI